MDTTKAARYEEIVAGFTKEELRRLPLAVEYCATLEEFLESTDPTVNIDLPKGKLLELTVELNLLMGEEIRVMQIKHRGIFARRREEERLARVAKLTEKREATFRAILQEFLFIQTALELHKLIYLAQVERMMDTMAKDELGLALKTHVESQASSIGQLNDSVMAKTTNSFRHLEASYQMHLIDVMIVENRQAAVDRISLSR